MGKTAIKTTMAIMLGILISSSLASSEFKVNSRTSNHQKNSDLAIDPNDNIIIVWDSYRADGNSGAIRGQVYDPNGSAVGSEFSVNTTTIGNQKLPSVASDRDGNFAVTWQGPGTDEEDIFTKIFNKNGHQISTEITVNTSTSARQISPKITMNRNGLFVITWEREYVPGEIDSRGISCRTFDISGTPISNEISVDSSGYCRNPDIAVAANGNFTVTWLKKESATISHCHILAKQYNSGGTCITAAFVVSDQSFNFLTEPSIAMNNSGDFLVAWASHPSASGQSNIAAKFYQNDLTASSEFTVNTTQTLKQSRPYTTANGTDFFVTFDSETADPNTTRNVYGQKLNGSSKIGHELLINSYIFKDQLNSAAASYKNKFLVVWQSDGQDGAGYGIFADFIPRPACGNMTDDLFVDFDDFSILANNWLQNASMPIDLTNDCFIDEQDLLILSGNWLCHCHDCDQADCSFDGVVNFEDYALWSPENNKTGFNYFDINQDGFVNLQDLAIINSQWLNTCPE